MTTLVFSDTHLSSRFDPKMYERLKKLIEPADRVIINGDLWDSDLTSFDSFLNSEWKKIFPLLKERHAIYIPGNHDEKKHMDERTTLFSDLLTDHYKISVGDKVVHIEHGHRIVDDLNIAHTLAKKIKIVGIVYRWLTRILIPLTKGKYLKLYSSMNKEQKLWAQKNLGKNEILVCGHSHLAEYSPNEQFINIGAQIDSLESCLIVKGDTITFVKEDLF
jgi:predicted phosphodiesterase